MSSTMMKNALPQGLMRMAGNYTLDCWFPPEDADGIATAQSVALGALNLDGAMVRSLVTNGRCVLARPASPNFTFTQATDACTIVMRGADQWGNDVAWTIVKPASGTVVKLLATGGARIPPMWRIDEIRITSVTAGTGTVSVGFNYSSGNIQSLTLPMTFPNWAAVQSNGNRLVFCESLEGFWTAGAPSGTFPAVSLTNDADAQRGVLPMTMGTTTASQTSALLTNANFTAATWTAGTFTLTKTGAFAGYEFQAGDTVTIVSGTGSTPGTYIISSKVDADNITLSTSPGVNAVDYVFRINQSTTGGFFLFKTNAFSGLTVGANTTISITGGTGVTFGPYRVIEKRSANLVLLETNPGGTNPTDVAFTITGMPTAWGRFRLLLDPDVLANQ